jgi:prepilin-type processing-associated H-X9-DG protein
LTTGVYGIVAYRHDSDNLSRTNVGFFDGHAETMDRNDVSVVDKPENAHSLWLYSK